ncbi:LytR/AlgR family response regulator transcription factor [Flavobacterium sp. JP2137]|uniref:LytR/AlgR family response regulator transcription factor n=1 Tax=Flavobacterium sp. JP2137 TaxID=3414510 RepID=UPI003D2FCE22
MDDLVLVIIDDEPKIRELLKAYIIRIYPERSFEIHLCNSVKTGVEAIKAYLPDLVFLDIEMPEANGFELFQHVNKERFEVVFTTAYAEYMDKSVNEIGCFAYLVKPVEREKLKIIFERYIEMKKNKQFLKLIHTTNNRRNIVSLSDILYCKAFGSYCEIFTTTDKFLQTRSLKEVEHRLPKESFIRIHNSYVVNINQVRSYSKQHKNVELKEISTENLQHIPVSATYKEKIERFIL